MERWDVIVVGAGIFGSAVTYHLAREGSQRVVAYEGGPGLGATASSAGILTVVGWDPWDLAVVRESSLELERLTERTGLCDFRADGAVRVARTREGAAWLDRARGVLEGAHLPVRSLGPGELGGLLPDGAFADAVAGLYTPSDATFSTLGVTAAYRRLARALGAELRAGDAPATVSRAADGWRVATPTETLEAPRLVLACGAWTKRLLLELGLPLPVAPFRTQAMELRPHPLARPFPTLHDLDLGIYARSASLGRVLAGNGTEPLEADPDQSDPAAHPEFVERIRSNLGELFPTSAPFAVERAWAGVCVASPDRYPLLGRIAAAKGLFVGTGFNGFGAMRAPALARRLAEGILHERWEPLARADPGRFPASMPSFDPRPEFPLEAPEANASPERTPTVPPTEVPPIVPEVGTISIRALTAIADVDALELPPLSEWFDPFLPLFMRDALRTGGEVSVTEVDGEPRGVYLYSPTEGVGSIFTRSRQVASPFLPGRAPGGVYADQEWIPGGEGIEVLAADLRDWEPRLPYRNPVRIASAADLPAVIAMMRELTGAVDSAWFDTLPRPEELCFLCEVDGRLAGMSWSSVVGEHARGHSFMVHPRFRGLGIGTDLLQARMTWLQEMGVRQVVSEIYEGNAASQTAAERAGMAVVARMFHYRPTGTRPGTSAR